MSWVSTAERIEILEQQSNRTFLRSLFNVSNNVQVIEGQVDKPILEGEAGGWFTKGGNRIFHPPSYGKRGWSNMKYKKSTYRIVVPFGTLEKKNIKTI